MLLYFLLILDVDELTICMTHTRLDQEDTFFQDWNDDFVLSFFCFWWSIARWHKWIQRGVYALRMGEERGGWAWLAKTYRLSVCVLLLLFLWLRGSDCYYTKLIFTQKFGSSDGHFVWIFPANCIKTSSIFVLSSKKKPRSYTASVSMIKRLSPNPTP